MGPSTKQELRRELEALREANRELERSRETLWAILESEPECVKTVSRDCRLLEMNPAGLKMIEADSIEQVRGADLLEIVAESHRDAFAEMNRRVFCGEKVIQEFEIVGLRGTRRWMETHAAPLRDDRGEVIAQLAITRDVSKRVAAEREREEMQEQLLHAQKLESLGVLAGGVAHDFNNLLTSVIGNTEIALSRSLEPYLAEDGMQALSIYREHREGIDLVLLDYTMPKMGGQQTLRSLREIDPEIRVLMSSGHPKNNVELDGAGFVHKPYRASELIEHVRAALGA